MTHVHTFPSHTQTHTHTEIRSNAAELWLMCLVHWNRWDSDSSEKQEGDQILVTIPQLLQREVLARPGRVQMEESPWGKGGGKWHSGNANLFIFRSQACRYWRTHLRSNGFVCWAWIIQKGYNIWQQHEQILKSLQVLAVGSCLFVVQAGSAVTKCWLQWNSAPPPLSVEVWVEVK